MSYDFLLSAFSFLAGSWIVLAVRTIQFRRKINVLETSLRLKELDPHNTFAAALSRLGKTALSTGEVLAKFPSVEPDDYPDKDKDGVPDAFQRRRPLSEILEFDKQPGEPGDVDSPGKFSSIPNEYWIAVELPARPPKKFEYFITAGRVEQSTINYSENYKEIIIKQTRNCRPEDLVELTK